MTVTGRRAAHRATGPAALLLLLPLAACTGGTSVAGSPTPAGSPGPVTSATTPSETSPPGPGSSGAEPSLGPSFPAGTSPAGGPAAGSAGAGQAGISLRLDSHPGYGRVELVLNTSGVPAWSVAYSDATGPGGAPVQLAGDAFLRVTVRTGDQDAQSGSQGSSSVTASGVVAGVRTLGTVDGSQQVLIGISGGQLPFRAVALTDPGRIVIDVRTP